MEWEGRWGLDRDFIQVDLSMIQNEAEARDQARALRDVSDG